MSGSKYLGSKTVTGPVREIFGSVESLARFDSCYSILRKVGYDSAEALWNSNPRIAVGANLMDAELESEALDRDARMAGVFSQFSSWGPT